MLDKDLIKEVREIIDPPVHTTQSIIRDLFQEFQRKVNVLEKENKHLRELIFEHKRRSIKEHKD